jgi:hypothetical protein
MAVVSVGLGFIVGVGLADSAADAHVVVNGYSWKTSGCSGDRVDPIGTMFYNASSAGALNHIHHHGWATTTSSDAQWWKTHGNAVCVANLTGASGERASGCGECDRFHVRVRTTYDSDPTYGTTAFATPHKESWHNLLPVGCFFEHAVDSPNGYIDAQVQLYANMVLAGGHSYVGGNHFWGNTGTVAQCTGQTPVNNGYVSYIRGN